MVGSKAGIQPKHASKLEDRLAQLNQASTPSDMSMPGWDLHPLVGELQGHWAVKVDRMWRITFMFEGSDVILVDYQDYH